MERQLPVTTEDCGCGPTPAERRTLFTRRSALGAALVGVATLGAIAGPMIPAAFAASYPSWDDVQRAKANQASKGKEITRIQGLISSLTANVAATRAVADQRAGEFYQAQQEYFDAAKRAEDLQSQADEQAAAATAAADKAGRVAAQLYRNGGDDTSLELFFSGSAQGADDLLARLGRMDKLLELNNDVYAAAVTARDTAQSFSDQAVVARTERDRLQQVAEQKMVESQRAADAAQAALDQQTEHLAVLQAQLSALQDATARTIKAYKDGVEAARKAKAEADRKAKAEAERLARQQGAGGVVSGGWARPSSGWRSSGYGPRTVVCGSGFCSSAYHYGVDLAAACGAAIFAAHAGVVTYTGYNGGYGNYIRLDHGGGIGTGYAHIRPGGIFVGNGQTVVAGQLIASEGNTGNSLGCHLHFETYVNGFPVNPLPFMAARGISL